MRPRIGGDVFVELNLDLDVGGDDGGDVTELVFEHGREIISVLGEAVVSVRAQREIGHQVFVVAESESDRRDRDTHAPGTLAEATELCRRARTDVGLSVREKDDPVDAIGALELPCLLDAVTHTGEQGRRAAGLESHDALANVAPIVGWRRWDENVNGAVVGDDGNDVIGAKTVENHDRGLFGADDLVARHRARAIDDESDVDRSPLLRRRLEALEAEFDVGRARRVGQHHRLADFKLNVNIKLGVLGVGDLRLEAAARQSATRGQKSQSGTHAHRNPLSGPTMIGLRDHAA